VSTSVERSRERCDRASVPAFFAGAVAGDMAIVESTADPFQSNQIDIQSTTNANEYTIIGRNGTKVQINGGPSILEAQTVNPITGNIYVALGPTADTVRFLSKSPTADSTVPRDLVIYHSDGDVIEIGHFAEDHNPVPGFTSGVTINGELAVIPSGIGGATLRVADSTVIGPTVVSSAFGAR